MSAVGSVGQLHAFVTNGWNDLKECPASASFCDTCVEIMKKVALFAALVFATLADYVCQLISLICSQSTPEVNIDARTLPIANTPPVSASVPSLQRAKEFLKAACVGDLDTLRQCIREGVDIRVNLWTLGLPIDRPGSSGYLFEFPAQRGDCPLELEPQIGATAHWTALYLACYYGKETIVQELLMHAKSLEKEIIENGDFETTPLHTIFQNYTPARKECLRVLLEHGANLESANKRDGRPCAGRPLDMLFSHRRHTLQKEPETVLEPLECVRSHLIAKQKQEVQTLEDVLRCMNKDVFLLCLSYHMTYAERVVNFSVDSSIGSYERFIFDSSNYYGEGISEKVFSILVDIGVDPTAPAQSESYSYGDPLRRHVSFCRHLKFSKPEEHRTEIEYCAAFLKTYEKACAAWCKRREIPQETFIPK